MLYIIYNDIIIYYNILFYIICKNVKFYIIDLTISIKCCIMIY